MIDGRLRGVHRCDEDSITHPRHGNFFRCTVQSDSVNDKRAFRPATGMSVQIPLLADAASCQRYQRSCPTSASLQGYGPKISISNSRIAAPSRCPEDSEFGARDRVAEAKTLIYILLQAE